MDETEFAELDRYVRGRLLAVGRPDIDERIIEARLGDRSGRDLPVIDYLQAVRREFILGTDETPRQTLRRLASSVTTVDGEAPEGLVVEVSGSDRDRYGVDEFRLTGSAELDGIVAALDDLIAELRESRPDAPNA